MGESPLREMANDLKTVLLSTRVADAVQHFEMRGFQCLREAAR